jgi:hypothetical protein
VSKTQADLRFRQSDWCFLVAQIIAFATGLLLTIPAEIPWVKSARETKVGLLAWIFEMRLDTTLPLILLAVVPFIWFVRRRSNREAASSAIRAPSTLSVAWAMAIACLLTSIAASAWVASYEVGSKPAFRFGELPPAYHDEFSYLFQAKTYLAGKLSFPSSPQMPELFDQMHVVNEGRFASRYFPGVGLWLAPFVAIGHPYWGEWLAAGLTAFFIFWAGRELAGNGVGLLVGLLTAVSPGMGLFSNLLLSHEPTMGALALFLFAFLRFMRTGRASDAFWAGCGLSFAMLCRPMTAAGFGLPFGLWFAWRCVRTSAGSRRPLGALANSSTSGRREPAETPRTATLVRQVAALAAPIIIGLTALFLYDQAITGNGFLSPYQLYTDIYTPRHVYGFNNVTRGEKRLGPKVLDRYDRWAKNLSPRMAAGNVRKRAGASARWTLGVVPLAMAVVVFVLAIVWRVDRRWWLVAAAVLTLHAVHVPYWFPGIMDWHYVFESGPLLLLIFAVTSQQLFRRWHESRRILMPAWWGTLIAAAVVTNWLPFDPFWSDSRVDLGVAEIAFARLHYAGFQRMLDQAVTQRPALVLIEGDPDDTSLDYVYNDPDLSAAVLRGRYRPGKTNLAKVHAAFPDRALYLYRVKKGQLTRIAG